ncbi:MAG: prenyltransferase [Actinomycetota bacterium]|nr:prenyltransferase [Actinomycetota bacterium]
MAYSTVQDLFADISTFEHAVVAYVDPDGYPVNVATGFHVDNDHNVIRLDAPAVPSRVGEGSEVNVTFSHIRPYPGVGYDQRRYVSVWGTVTRANGSIEVTPARSHGWDEERLSFFELCERSVPAAHRYIRKVGAEQGRTIKPMMSLGWVVFLATRLPFLTGTVVPVMLGAVIARAHGFSQWWLTVLALMGACAIHLGLNVLNDVSDATSGADEANVNPTMYSGGSRVIQYGLVSLRAMRVTAACLYAVGIGIGLYLVATRGIELLWIGLIGVFLSVFYTAPPLRLVHRGLGELCVAIGFGPVMVLGTYFVVAKQLSWEAFYASLPVAIFIMLILYVNQIPDRRSDAATGKRTIVVRLPKSAIVWGYAASVAAALGLIIGGVGAGIMPAWTLIALLPIPIAVQVYKAISSHYDSPYELMKGMGQNVALHFFTGVLLILGYVLAIVF